MNILLLFDFISNDTVDTEDVFTYINRPKIDIHDYVRRVYKHIVQDPEILSFALYYMATYTHYAKTQICQFNVHRIFLVACVISHKFWDDESYGNYDLAKIGGVTNNELNKMEIIFLKSIQWRLYEIPKVTNSIFLKIVKKLTGFEYAVLEDEKKRLDDVKMVKSIVGDIVNYVVDSHNIDTMNCRFKKMKKKTTSNN